MCGCEAHHDSTALCSCDCPAHDQKAKTAEACSRFNARLIAEPAPAAVADNAGGYDGPVIGLDGLPVPCQMPGCSRRAATKALCTRHRGLPRPAASPGGQADDDLDAQAADWQCTNDCCKADDGRTEELRAAIRQWVEGNWRVTVYADQLDRLLDRLAPLLAAATTGRGDDAAVQRVLEACDELKEDAKLAKRLADEAQTRGDRELQRINIRHARVASHAASAIRGAVAGGQDGPSC